MAIFECDLKVPFMEYSASDIGQQPGKTLRAANGEEPGDVKEGSK